ncbi:hypothetical protein JG688_00015458 [Phytophthora aleatoria]|uniref:Uncharacterized protein n=1 Tax=Phytophthora aleatoria TaxID=2496075 RepID=A0A8J5I5G7_9STRA|nr:hypothetical protein JG688_00015458 [Phytophthora aleatoria]
MLLTGQACSTWSNGTSNCDLLFSLWITLRFRSMTSRVFFTAMKNQSMWRSC